MMTLRAASHLWPSRDIPRALALLVWAAFLIGLAINFFDWSPFRQAVGLKPQVKSAAGQAIFDGDAIYTGSIFFVPRFGDYCWQRMIDNRNGTMWDKGYINCDDAVSELVENKQRGSLSSVRMQSISKAFHRDEN